MIAVKKGLRGEEGYTITEMMVVVLILGVLMGAFYSFLFGGDRAAEDGRDWLELNQTARLSFERLTRELREADIINGVSADSSGKHGAWGISFQADFNASGSFTPTGTYVPLYEGDESLTYRYDSGLRQLLISTAATPTETALVENVAAFRLSYFGSDPRADVGCAGWIGTPVPSDCLPGDGVVLWQELDNTPKFGIGGFGNGTGALDAGEFPHITSITVEMTVSLRQESHNYRTAVELRNLFR